MGLSDKVPGLVAGFVLCLGSVYILWTFRKTHSSQQLFWILTAGYLLRMLCMLLDLCARGGITILHSGQDTEKFYRLSVAYYANDYGDYSTNYPNVLRWIYEVFGQSRLIAQYANIFFWFLTACVIIHMCESAGIGEKHRMVPYAVLAFWPNWVFLSSILLRESIQIFWDSLSFYCFVGWMRSGRRGRLVLAFLAVLPAIYLHMASVAVWAVYIAVASVWDAGKQKASWRFGKQAKMLFALALFAAFCLLTPFRGVVLSKMNREFSLWGITHQIFYDGRSDYLREMDYRYWYQLVPFTVVRMFYLVFSPLPWDFKGVRDVLAFLMESLPILLLTGEMCRNIRSGKGSAGYAKAGLLVCVMIVGIFAWGTSNAGTAMRHRTVMAGVWVMAYCLSMASREGNGWTEGSGRESSSAPLLSNVVGRSV